MSSDEDELRPTARGPCAVKVARTVPTGGMEKRAIRHRALSLPTSVLVQLGLLDPSMLPIAGMESARKALEPTLPSNTLIQRAERGA
jgi:hypothetical protein